MKHILHRFTVFALVATTAHAADFAGIFSQGMVLQQGMPVPIWGVGKPGEEIAVKFAGQEKPAKVAEDGRWMVKLDSLKASADPQVLSVSFKGGEKSVTDVLVGEVWLASGQSNMAYVMNRSKTCLDAMPKTADPLLRLSVVGGRPSEAPVTNARLKWMLGEPSKLWEFSAVAYFFARDVRAATKVPVGIMVAAVGATMAETWTSQAALESNPALKNIIPESQETLKRAIAKADEDYQKLMPQYEEEVAKAKAEGKRAPRPPLKVDPTTNPNIPSRLYNGMIAPLAPFAFRGVIWYQGESNAHEPELYKSLFPAMIKDWRQAFGHEFPFLFVQIAPYKDMVPEIRDAQLFTWRTVSNTAMAVITDHGDEKGIHPADKEPVGARLALAARAIAYGEKIEYSGPVFDKLKIEGNKAILSFTHIGDGLVAKGDKLTGFEISGDGTHFVAGTATIAGDTVVVTSEEVKSPSAVRFGWANVPNGNLFNKNDLPATPFHTGTK